MKILICGDRDWDDYEKIYEVLQEFPADTIVVHGGCRGADQIAAAICEELGMTPKEYPYIKALGRAGGPARNTQMAQENPDIEVVIGFHNNIENSKGTKDMLFRAAPQYIPNAKIRVIEVLQIKGEK